MTSLDPKRRPLVFGVAYHAESTLTAVLERIPPGLFESYNCEILVIDDASTDRTFAIGRGISAIDAVPPGSKVIDIGGGSWGRRQGARPYGLPALCGGCRPAGPPRTEGQLLAVDALDRARTRTIASQPVIQAEPHV